MEDINLERKTVTRARTFNFDSVGFLVLMALTFILPLFFLPSSLSLGNFDKPLIATFGIFIISILWIIARLKDNRFPLQKSLISLASFFLVVTFLVSALASSEKDISFFGYGYETGTFFFVFLMILLMFLSSFLLDSKKKINKLFSALYISSAILFLIQLINIFKNLNFIGLASSNQTLIGSWNNLGIFFGLITIIFFCRLSEETDIKSRTYLSFGLVLSLIALSVVNFTLSWTIVLVASVFYSIYRFVKERNSPSTRTFEGERDLSFSKKVYRALTWPIILVFLMSLVFVIFGRDAQVGSTGGILNRISESIVQSPLEVRPSMAGTLEVAGKQISENSLIGSGLNRFNYSWQKFKPGAVTQNPYFWNTEFLLGHGYLTTFLTTAGILGSFGVLALFLAVLFLVFKGIVKSFSSESHQGKISLIISSIATLYLWVMLLLYVPSTAIIVLTFIVTGAHIALLREFGLIKEIDFSKVKPQVYSFISVLALVLFAILVVGLGFSYTQKAMAWKNFSDGVNKVLSGDVEGGYVLLGKAVRLDKRDLYYRIKSEAGLMRLSAIVNQEGRSNDELKREFQAASVEAYTDAKIAMELNPSYYPNYLGLAKVYTSLIPYGVKDASSAAIDTYDQAMLIAPKNPIIPYEKATLYFALNKRKEGEEALEKSIALKPNFTDALYLRSQLAIKDGKLDKALKDTYSAVSIDPTNTGLLFQLGYLEYRAGNYQYSVTALAQAVNINPSYSNARYFLGLSLDKIGKRADAIEQFKIVLQLNPDNQNVKDVIENLSAGRDPFVGAPVQSLPDNSETPPIDEKN